MSERPPPVEAVFFDLGGTLIDERNPEVWAECARASGLELTPDTLVHFFEEVEMENDQVGNRMGSEQLWQRALVRATGEPVDVHRVRGYIACIRERGLTPHLFSDVRRCLEQLRRDKYRMGIVSNSQSEPWVRAILDRLDILRFFETVISSGSEGMAKPDPAIFLRAADRLGVLPAASFFIGNLPNVDAKAAAAAGMHSLWLHRGGTGFGDDPPEITSLSELPGELRALRRRAR